MSAVLQPPSGTVNYQGQLFSFPSLLRVAPPAHEGDRFVAFAIDWGADTTAGVRSIAIDLTRGGVQPISQIAALWVDNSGSNADVQFLFLSTQTRIVVPAQASEMVPVSTNDVRMTVVAPTSGAGDLTFGQIFNFVPPPVALAETEFASVVANANIIMPNTTTSVTPLVAAGVNGVIRSIDISVQNALSAANNTDQVQLLDGNAVVLYSKFFIMRAGINTDNYNLSTLSGLAIPFHNGINVNQTTVGPPTSGAIGVIISRD